MMNDKENLLRDTNTASSLFLKQALKKERLKIAPAIFSRSFFISIRDV